MDIQLFKKTDFVIFRFCWNNEIAFMFSSHISLAMKNRACVLSCLFYWLQTQQLQDIQQWSNMILSCAKIDGNNH